MSHVEFLTEKRLSEWTYEFRVTRSLKEALRWFDAGCEVMVKIDGWRAGIINEGKEVEDMDDDVFYDDSYGTIHYVKELRIRRICLPNDSDIKW